MSKRAWGTLVGITLLIIVIFAIAMFVPFIWGRGQGYGFSMMGPGMMYGVGFSLFRGIGMLLFWVLIIGGLIWLLVSVSRGKEVDTIIPSNEPLIDILKRRYAKGEITKEQFEQMKQTLGL